MDTAPFCFRCAGLQKTCCQTADIFVTQGDRERIALYSGENDFWEIRSTSDPAYLQQDHDPVWRDNVFSTDGSRPVLKKQNNGDCLFLAPDGCRLPMEIRPLTCRMQPFIYTAEGISTEFDERCPGCLLQPHETIVTAMQLNQRLAEYWRTLLYREIVNKEGKDSA